MSTTIEHAAGQQQQAAGKAIVKQYYRQLCALLPPHVRPETWYAGVISALDKSAELADAANRNPESLMYALFESARLGLPPGTDRYWLTPRPNNKAKGRKEVLGIVGYRGDIELIYNAGVVASVVVEVVRRNDFYQYRRGIDPMPVHTFDPWARHADRGEIVGCYTYGIMKDGAVSRVIELNLDDIERAMRSSPTASSSYSPWKTDYASMVLKTGVHRLRKFVPSSPELRYTAETMRHTAEAIGGARGQNELEAGRKQLPTSGPAVVHPEQDQPALTYTPSPDTGADDPSGEDGPDPDEPPTDLLDREQFAQPAAPEDGPPEPAPAVDQHAGQDPTPDDGAAPSSTLVTEFTAPPARGDDPPATQAQTKAIGSILGRAKFGEDEQRFPIVSRMVGRPRPVKSFGELTKAEASRVLELLSSWSDAKVQTEQLQAVLDAATAAAASADLPAPGTPAWHQQGHPTETLDGKVQHADRADGECSICEDDAVDRAQAEDAQ